MLSIAAFLRRGMHWVISIQASFFLLGDAKLCGMDHDKNSVWFVWVTLHILLGVFFFFNGKKIIFSAPTP